MSQSVESDLDPFNDQSIPSVYRVERPANQTWKRVLVLFALVLILGGLMSVESSMKSAGELVLFRKPLRENKEIVVLQGPFHAAPTLDGLFKASKEYPDLGATEIRVELRNGAEVVPLWISLRRARLDPGNASMFYVLDVIVRQDYFVLVTYEPGFPVTVRKIFPFGSASIKTCADAETVELASWTISSLIPTKDTDVAVEVKELPDNRFSLTIKDMRVGPPDPKGNGWEYPVFEQDESGKWDFRLKNPSFMNSK